MRESEEKKGNVEICVKCGLPVNPARHDIDIWTGEALHPECTERERDGAQGKELYKGASN